MIHRALRACVLTIGAALLIPIAALAEDDSSTEPGVVDIAPACHGSIDPGFIATIEDRSNDKGFIATAIDISNDTGFLIPVAEEPVDAPTDGVPSALCPSVVPLPLPGQP